MINNPRPLAGIEVASLFYNIITNSLGISILNSFIQVTKKGEIHDYFLRGKEIAEKQIQVLSKVLNENDLPVPITWNAGVSDSTTPPFSEKLMLYLISFLNAQGLSNYGNSISNTMRQDIGIDFTRLATEVADFGKDGMKLIIKNGWMEMPPHAKGQMK